MKKLIIKNIKINNFRNLHDIDLNFNGLYNEISGKNGLGKTSILDAIRFILFGYNDKNKKQSNIKTIATDFYNPEIKNPDLEAVFSFDDRDFSLMIKNNKYYFNGIHQKNSTTYYETIAKNLELENIDQLSQFLHYTKLQETISSQNSQDKIDFVNVLISIINGNLDANSQIDPKKLEIIPIKIANCEDEIKFIKKTMSSLNQEKNWLISNNPDIKDWDNEITLDETKINEIEESIKNYENISNEIQNCLDKIQILNLKKHENDNKIKSLETHNINKKEKNKLHIIVVILLFLTIIGGIIFLLLNRSTKSDSESSITSDLRNLENDNKWIEKEINDIEKKIIELKNNKNHKNVDIQSLRNKWSEFKATNNNMKNIISIKAKFKTFKEKNLQCKQKLKTKIDELTNLKNEHNNNIKQIDCFLNKFFNKYSVKFPDDYNTNSNLDIFYEGIDFKNLNYAAKTNISLSISNFLKQKYGVQIFDLVDQRESINDLMNETDNQIISCKVTEDDELKLNEKNIN